LLGFRLAGPGALADLARRTALAYIRVTGAELRIGSLTSHADLLAAHVVAEHFPVLREAERIFAGLFTTRRETIGGTLCQARPANDLLAALTAVHATMVIDGTGGRRVVPARDFQPRAQETVIEAGEFLTEVRIPIRPGCGGAYEMGDPAAGSCGAAGAAAVIWLDRGTVTAAGLALTPVSGRHPAVMTAERFLTGGPATARRFARAARIAARQCACSSGRVEEPGRPAPHAPDCRAAALVTRALSRALLRARGLDPCPAGRG
jgi:carbon-monoxide dehydrogenase medium subunit